MYRSVALLNSAYQALQAQFGLGNPQGPLVSPPAESEGRLRAETPAAAVEDPAQQERVIRKTFPMPAGQSPPSTNRV